MADAAPADRAVARSLTQGLTLHLADVADALSLAYGDAYTAGLLISAQLTGHTPPGLQGVLTVPDNPSAWGAFWDGWTPGSSQAASLLENGGLADLLASSDITVKGIGGSLLDSLGNRLADDVASGLGVDDITNDLMDYVGDPARALMIARTETARAVSAATMDGYRAAGVPMVDWLVSADACPLCDELGANGPYTLQDAPDQPAHPNCRCSYSPTEGSAASSVPGEGE